MTDTETPMPTINSFYDNETSTEYAVEDTVARARAEAAQEAAEAAQEAAGAGVVTDPVWVQHRNTYRGKNLGDEFTEEQKAMIAAGTFDDLYVGDFWVDDGVKIRVADFNALNSDQNHVVVIPDSGLYQSVIIQAGKQNNGFAGGDLYATGLNSANQTFASFFGDGNVLEHEVLLTNAKTVGSFSSLLPYIIASAKAMIPSAKEVFGTSPLASDTYGASQQFSLFALNPMLIYNGETFWLRNQQANEDRYGVVFNNGFGYMLSDANNYVRPYAGISGQN